MKLKLYSCILSIEIEIKMELSYHLFEIPLWNNFSLVCVKGMVYLIILLAL